MKIKNNELEKNKKLRKILDILLEDEKKEIVTKIIFQDGKIEYASFKNFGDFLKVFKKSNIGKIYVGIKKEGDKNDS